MTNPCKHGYLPGYCKTEGCEHSKRWCELPVTRDEERMSEPVTVEYRTENTLIEISMWGWCVLGVYPDRESAEQAIKELEEQDVWNFHMRTFYRIKPPAEEGCQSHA